MNSTVGLNRSRRRLISSAAGTVGPRGGWRYVVDPKQLMDEALDAERLAAVVSYGPDKQRLRHRAAELRRQAAKAQGAPPPL